MIEKIHTIKNFGVFKDFNWNRDSKLKEFNDKNIIYGWNYSGKTTISRIFSSLRDHKLHEDYPDGVFEIIDDGIAYTSNDLGNYQNLVCVFNKEYIDDTLSWKNTAMENKWEPISFEIV